MGCQCDPNRRPSDSSAPHPADSSADSPGDSSTGHSADSSDSPVEPAGPDIPHEHPVDGAMCFDCHICGGEEQGHLEVTHYVCVDCHVGPDGSVPEELQDDCGCDGVDCDADPAVTNCGDCHTDGSNDTSTAADMNRLCTVGCHLAGE